MDIVKDGDSVSVRVRFMGRGGIRGMVKVRDRVTLSWGKGLGQRIG